MSSASAHASDDKHVHVLPIKVYVGVLSTLLFLTVVTVAVAQVDLGGTTNLIIAMLVATVKGSLVCLIFMHLWWDNKLYMFVFLSSLFFLFVFIVLTMFDTEFRGYVHEEGMEPIRREAVIYEHIREKSAAGGYGHHGDDSHHASPDDHHAAPASHDAGAADGTGH